jgi:biopolymer transport protein ExbD
MEHNLEIWVDAAGNLYLAGEPASLRIVEGGIVDAYLNAPDTRVHVIADRNTKYENVNKVLDILQTLEYRVVSLVVRD